MTQGKGQQLPAQGRVVSLGVQPRRQRLNIPGQRSGPGLKGFGLVGRQLRQWQGRTVGFRVPVHGAPLRIVLGFRQQGGMFRAKPLQQGPQLRVAFHGEDALSGKGAQRAALRGMKKGAHPAASKSVG